MSAGRPGETVRELARVVGYTLGAALVLGMYLIVPVLLALDPRVPPLGTRMLIAVILLATVEVPVIVVLIRTTRTVGALGPEAPTRTSRLTAAELTDPETEIHRQTPPRWIGAAAVTREWRSLSTPPVEGGPLAPPPRTHQKAQPRRGVRRARLHGAWLLGGVALGFVAYGAIMMVQACYRRLVTR